MSPLIRSALPRAAVLASSFAVTQLACTPAGNAAEREDTAITIYSSAQPGAIPPELYRPVQGMTMPGGRAIPGYAVVRHERPVNLSAGRSDVRFVDVAALIDPTTVQFTSLTDPNNTRVLEQNFQFDLVSTQKLLMKYIDKPLTLERVVGNQLTTLSGTLLSAVDGLVLRGADGQIYAIRDYSNIRFPDLPGGLITRPTLEWNIAAKRGGEHRARVAYQTGGITWWADYNLTFSEGSDANSGLLDVGAWVSILNQSGAGYPDARLKLIAGDVHRAEPQALPMAKRAREMMSAVAADEAAGFEEKAFFEYHLYTLGRRTTLPDNSTKQIELFDVAHRVPARKTLVYYGQGPIGYWYADPMVDRNFGTQSNRKVDVYLRFKNDEKVGLGIPLPAGRIRVYQARRRRRHAGVHRRGRHRPHAEGRESAGEARHRPSTSSASASRWTSASTPTAKWMEEEIEVKLRNHKKEAVDVIVKENLYRWTNWEIKSSSHELRERRRAHDPLPGQGRERRRGSGALSRALLMVNRG